MPKANATYPYGLAVGNTIFAVGRVTTALVEIWMGVCGLMCKSLIKLSPSHITIVSRNVTNSLHHLAVNLIVMLLE